MDQPLIPVEPWVVHTAHGEFLMYAIEPHDACAAVEKDLLGKGLKCHVIGVNSADPVDVLRLAH